MSCSRSSSASRGCGGSSAASNGCGGSGGSSGSSGSGSSALEKEILNASSPISVSETETITVNGESGIFVNKQEVESFSGPIPLNRYEINNDSNPKVIRKQMAAGKGQAQIVSVKFLQPPAASAGDIIVKQGPAKSAPAAPPVIIRQQGCGKAGSKSQTFREKPPCVKPEGPKEICIPGGCVPPPPRRVIIEKVPGAAGGAGKITVERWLAAPAGGERRVILKKSGGGSKAKKVQNVVIEWSQAEGETKQEIKVEGVKQADPMAYKMRYGSKLQSADSFPAFVRNIPAPSGKQFASEANGQGAAHKLTGDVAALRGVDLEAHGLLQYAAQIYKGAGASGGNDGCDDGPKC